MISRGQMPREYNKGTMPARNKKKNFRSTKSGAGMTRAGVAAYRRKNPGSKLKTAVTGKVKGQDQKLQIDVSRTVQEAQANEKISKGCKRS